MSVSLPVSSCDQPVLWPANVLKDKMAHEIQGQGVLQLSVLQGIEAGHVGAVGVRLHYLVMFSVVVSFLNCLALDIYFNVNQIICNNKYLETQGLKHLSDPLNQN